MYQLTYAQQLSAPTPREPKPHLGTPKILR